MKIFVKVNVGAIIQDHVNTLVNAKTKKPGWDDWMTFVVIPALFSLLISHIGIGLGTNAITIIITALSIFVGLLFNVVVLVFDILKRDSSNPTKNRLLRQILANISFTILLSIFIIALSFISLVKGHAIFKICTDYIIYFFLSVFFITLVMVLKRMYLLFENEMKEIERLQRMGTEEKEGE